MSNVISIRLNPEQGEQVVKQAQKADEKLSEYVLKATEQRIDRELKEQRANELNLESELDDLADIVAAEVDGATDIDTDQELFYSVALWDLISSEFPADKRAAAMEGASEKVQEEVESIRNKEGQE
ncbi:MULTISPECIES: hypothetical protein [Haloarcula]|uniref:Ribbon-helix-helix protein n=2 Tax=Haloarcula TaxID=2237 RepID=A0A847U597_9EURY|nr:MULTISPECIES: hypothetical protein [Haloarcula]EMA14615.1 ribbon-helix-helix protein [Haloarcula amylolytica JCM 13557]NHX41989.1 hypothetical protein [Haloarcula sp. R1-2]NLV08169.1 hypothetical protein [Haloarcula rubripromontorii]